jgi:hypothetical protein
MFEVLSNNEWVIGVALAIGVPILIMLIHSQNEREYERNKGFDPPDDLQVRWHVRHIREDVRLIAYILMAILVTLWVR